MKVKAKRFARMVRQNGVSLLFVARELGLSLQQLIARLLSGDEFDYAESKELMAMFGADEMAKVIDWEAINACNAIG